MYSWPSKARKPLDNDFSSYKEDKWAQTDMKLDTYVMPTAAYVVAPWRSWSEACQLDDSAPRPPPGEASADLPLPHEVTVFGHLFSLGEWQNPTSLFRWVNQTWKFSRQWICQGQRERNWCCPKNGRITKRSSTTSCVMSHPARL